MHYVVRPLAYGTYENEELLNMLAEAGFDVNARDAEGVTPLEYAR
ncbi:ankyrin repeat domain-containing protein, partial [Acinetobacter baumannii]